MQILKDTQRETHTHTGAEPVSQKKKKTVFFRRPQASCAVTKVWDNKWYKDALLGKGNGKEKKKIFSGSQRGEEEEEIAERERERESHASLL